MSNSAQFVPTRSRLLPSLAMAVILCFGFGAAGQSIPAWGARPLIGQVMAPPRAHSPEAYQICLKE